MNAVEQLSSAFGLAFLRYLPAVALPALTPLRWAPPLVRIVLTAGLAWLTVLSLSQDGLSTVGSGDFNWIAAAVGELSVGLAFGLVLMIPMAALNLAGWVLDIQAGLSAGTLFNPGAQGDMQSLIGTAIGLLATVLFFVLDLHLEFYKAIIASARVLPLGRMGADFSLDALLGLIGNGFLLGLAVVMPVVVALFAVDVGVGYASRAMPQANVFFLVLPMKIAVALLLMVIVLPFIPALIERLFLDSFQRLPSLIGA